MQALAPAGLAAGLPLIGPRWETSLRIDKIESERDESGVGVVFTSKLRQRRAVMEVQLEIFDFGDALKETKQQAWPGHTFDNLYQWGIYY